MTFARPCKSYTLGSCSLLVVPPNSHSWSLLEGWNPVIETSNGISKRPGVTMEILRTMTRSATSWQDIFAGLISLIFIIDGARPIIANFADGVMPLTNCFFEALLFFYTFGLATYLSGMRRTPWMLRPLRNLMANFSVTIALVSASALAAIYASDVSLRMLQVDAELEPNLQLASGEKRPWVVNPSGIETEFPAWGIAFAIIPAIGFTVLGYLDQNLTSVIVNRPSNNLKKGPGYHLDLFVRGAITLPACAVLGLPLSVASTVPSITHVSWMSGAKPDSERKIRKSCLLMSHVF